MSLNFILIMFASALLTYFGIAVFRKLSLNKEWLDVPNQRSSHDSPTPRGAGLIVVPLCLIGYVLATWVSGSDFSWGYFLGALLVALVSWLDDLYSISFGWRLMTHVLAACLVLYSEGYWTAVSIGDGRTVFLGSAGAIITAAWIIWVINAYNFMDGIDGIAGVQGLVASAAWAAIAAKEGNGIYLFALIVFSSLVGFILHNWHPAKVFIGDVGSAFLGFTFATFPLLVSRSGFAGSELLPVVAVLVLWPFIFDTILTMVRRAFRREMIWQAHREHLYQRLNIAGRSHSLISILYGVFAIATSSAAILLLWTPGKIALASVMTTFAVSLILTLVVSRAYRNALRLSSRPNEAQ